MKKISIWASHNKWISRFLIVFGFVLLHVLGFFTGDILSSLNIAFPPYAVYIFAALFLTAFFLYPSKKEKAKYQNFYVRQKTTDGVLVTTTYLMIICLSNHSSNAGHSFAWQPVRAATVSENSSAPKEAVPSIQPAGKKVLKQWKKFKQQVKELRKAYRDKDSTDRTLLVILASLAAAVLLMLVFYLSCSLACSGSDGAAVAVLLLGAGLVVFLLIKVIQAIYRKQRPPKNPESGTISTAPAA